MDDIRYVRCPKCGNEQYAFENEPCKACGWLQSKSMRKIKLVSYVRCPKCGNEQHEIGFNVVSGTGTPCEACGFWSDDETKKLGELGDKGDDE